MLVLFEQELLKKCVLIAVGLGEIITWRILREDLAMHVSDGYVL